jgi:hypothetical protein
MHMFWRRAARSIATLSLLGTQMASAIELDLQSPGMFDIFPLLCWDAKQWQILSKLLQRLPRKA